MKSNHYSAIFNSFQPQLVSLDGDLQALLAAYQQTNLLICGEIHGIKENADIFYTLVHYLGVQHIGIECDPRVQPFLDSAQSGTADFSLIDAYTFESSPLSIEMVKTIAILTQEGYIHRISYLDTYFMEDRSEQIDSSPALREKKLADNILAIDLAQPTACLLGQWHTIPTVVSQRKYENDNRALDVAQPHYSALYRVRQKIPNATFVHNIYRSGELYNVGQTISLPFDKSLPGQYTLNSIDEYTFDLTVPVAHKITL